jgi:hypothetical protein
MPARSRFTDLFEEPAAAFPNIVNVKQPGQRAAS